jgi:hypothetical protein
VKIAPFFCQYFAVFAARGKKLTLFLRLRLSTATTAIDNL